MKKNIILLLLAAMLTSSCSDWLDVAPSNQVNDKEMFSTGDGYRNALNGIYLKLSGSSMYGRELSWGFIDVLGQHYLTDGNFMKASSTYKKASDYKYDDSDVKSVISAIWSTGYNDIANCNNLIRQIGTENPLLFAKGEMEKNMIWGEALAMRAFIHLDMLRMFAPAMEVDDHKAYIPYVDTYPTTSTTYGTNTEILSKIEKDLKDAKDLLATCDTIAEHKVWMSTGYRMLASGTTNDLPDDVFFAYRGFRMNYYAVTAMLARTYCWAGRYEDAFKQAKEVADASYQNSSSMEHFFDFEKASQLSTNLKDYNSLLLAFSSTTLTEDYLTYVTKQSDSANPLLMLDADVAYEGSKEDQRGIALLGTMGGSRYSTKHTIKAKEAGSDMIPIIRLSEIYYIMGEYYARNNDWKMAGDMLGAVRSARGIISKSLALGSMDEFKTELLKEVRKEFVGEGQLFFQQKRLNVKPVDKAVFVFGRPDNENI